MSSFGVIRRILATSRVVAACVGWNVVLFGWAATLLFFAWVLASIPNNKAGLADAMFYGFSFALVVPMGLWELHRSTPTAAFHN